MITVVVVFLFFSFLARERRVRSVTREQQNFVAAAPLKTSANGNFPTRL